MRRIFAEQFRLCDEPLVVAAILVLCESNPVEHLCESRVLIRLADARPFEPPAVRLQWRWPHHLWGNYQKQRLCFVHLWFFYLLPLVCGTLSSTFECWTCANSLRALIPSIAITHLLSSQPGGSIVTAWLQDGANIRLRFKVTHFQLLVTRMEFLTCLYPLNVTSSVNRSYSRTSVSSKVQF